MKKMPGYTTRVLNTPFVRKDPNMPLHMPVYETVAYEFDTADDIAAAFQDRAQAHTYSRATNPTVEYFETKVKHITDSFGVIALSSGMAAISNAVLALVGTGDNIISSPHLFGHTSGLFNKTFRDLGIETRFADLSDIESIKELIDNKTRVLFFETITNPQLEIVDIKKLAELVHEHNVVVMADTTLTPPNIFDSKSLGVDIEVMSSTKIISGGATSVGGIIIDNGITDWSAIPKLKDFYDKVEKKAFIAKLRKEIYRNFGSCMSPQTAHMQNLGLDILAIRFDRMHENCSRLAEFLSDHTGIQDVNYPGLKGNPYFSLAEVQFFGRPGTILTFDLNSEKACYDFMDKLQVIRRATNLNDNKSLIIHPYSTIYFEFPREEKLKLGIKDTMLRLSVGIEEVADLIEDITKALNSRQ
jgi:O-acetylhomoserine (thiol)-lyase